MKRTICFDCGASPWKERLRHLGAHLARVVRKAPAGRHCENCDKVLQQPVDAWQRERYFQQDEAARAKKETHQKSS